MAGWMMTMTALALQAPAPLPVPDTVRDFLTAAEALMAQGEAGVNTPEADAVRLAIQQSASAYRAALAESASRGEKAASCPPAPGQAQITVPTLIDAFRAFPEPHRDMPLATAFALVMTLRYPCKTAPQ